MNRWAIGYDQSEYLQRIRKSASPSLPMSLSYSLYLFIPHSLSLSISNYLTIFTFISIYITSRHIPSFTLSPITIYNHQAPSNYLSLSRTTSIVISHTLPCPVTNTTISSRRTLSPPTLASLPLYALAESSIIN